MASYIDTANNDEFVTRARRTLMSLGQEDPGYDRTKITDAMLKERRYFNVNLPQVIQYSSLMGEMTAEDKYNLAYSFNAVDQIPATGEGSVPTWNALKDYTGAVFSDPANIIGIVAAAYTGGTSLYATQATKEAAKQGVMGYIKNKVAAATSKSTLKALGAEASITGAAGFGRSLQSQSLEKEIGLRKDVSVGRAVATGVLEGPLSVAIGYTGGTLLKDGAKAIDNNLMAGKMGDGASYAANWVKSTFLPKSLADENIIRLQEQFLGLENYYSKQSRVYGEALDKAIKAWKPENVEEGFNLVNKAAEGDEIAYSQLPDDIAALLAKNKSIAQEISERAINLRVRDPDNPGEFVDILSPKFKQMWDNNDSYLRNIYRVFTKPSEQTAQRFSKLMEDGSIVREISELIATKPDWVLNLPKSALKGFTISERDALLRRDPQAIEKLARNFYDNTKGTFRIEGSAEARVALQSFQKTLWGQNYSPGERFIQSIEGQMSMINRIAFGASTAESLLQRGLGVQARTAKDAAEMFNNRQQVGQTSNLTPETLVHKSDMVKVFGEDSSSMIRIPSGRIDSRVHDVWIPKYLADRFKPAYSAFADAERFFNNYFVSQVVSMSARMQGSLKIGKVPLSPVSIIRNTYGAAQAVAGSGNVARGIKRLISVGFAGKEQRDTLARQMQEMGIAATSVDLGQILVRLGRELDADPTLIEKVFTLGFAGAFPKTYRGALKFYGGIDDFSKMVSFLGELDAEQALWKTLSAERKAAKRKAIEPSLPMRFERGGVLSDRTALARAGDEGEILPGSTPLTVRGEGDPRQAGVVKPYSDDEIIQEIATRRTMAVMPIYTRTPAFIDAFKGIPVLGNFSSYPAEVFRNGANITRIAAEELEEGFQLNNWTLIGRGMTRLASISALATAPFALSAYANGKNQNYKKVAALRPYLPEWNKYGAITISSIKDAPNDDVEIEYQNLAYSSAYGPLTQSISPLIMSAASGGDVKGVLQERLLHAYKYFASPYVEPSMLAQSFKHLMDGEYGKWAKTVSPTLVRHGVDAMAESGKLKGINTLKDISNALPEVDVVPGLSLEKLLTNKTAGEGYNPPKTLKETGETLWKKGYNPTGLSTYKLSARKITNFAVRHLKQTEDEARADFKKSLMEILGDPYEPINQKEILKNYDEVLKTQFALLDGKMQMLDNLKTLIGEEKALKIWSAAEVKAGNKKERIGLTYRTDARGKPVGYPKGKPDPRALTYLFSQDKSVITALKNRKQIRENPQRIREIHTLLLGMREVEKAYWNKPIYGGVPDGYFTPER